MDIIRKNFALKVLAVALAIVGWAYFRLAGNSSPAEQLQQLSIPITAVNLPLGYVAHFDEREAVVTVASKRGEPALRPDDIKAVLDLANKNAGVYNVPVALVAPQVAVQSLSPASVTLTIERIDQRSFPITVQYVGAQPKDIVVSATAVRPDAALVSAPTSLLAQVAGLRVNVTLPGEPKAVDEMLRPLAVDASGTELMGLSVEPNLVRVQIRFVAGAGSAR